MLRLFEFLFPVKTTQTPFSFLYLSLDLFTVYSSPLLG